jgi:hypothetical protein
MAIFGALELEPILQVNDKTRLNATKSYISKDEPAITLVRIEPETGNGFVTVSGTGLSYKDWYLDWTYTSAGTKTVSIEITTTGSPVVVTKDIVVVTAVVDGLWSSDQDLVKYEPDILKWIKPGRSSFLDMHRAAQTEILDWLDEQRIWDIDGNRFTKADILVTDEVRKLSTYWALQLIYFGLQNQPDDVFSQKGSYYEDKVLKAKNRGRLLIDFDKDTEQTNAEAYEMRSIRIYRR